MRTGAKVAITVVLSLAIGLTVLVGGIGYVIYWGGFGDRTHANVVPVAMINESALNRSHYVDHTWQCRLRLPNGQYSASPEPSSSNSDGGFKIQQGTHTFIVMQDTRKFRSFEAYVSANKTVLTLSDNLKNVAIVSEGRTTINDVRGYLLEITCEALGTPVHERMVLLDGPDKKVYLVCAACTSADWFTNANTIESCFSTFEIGDFPDDAPEPTRGPRRFP